MQIEIISFTKQGNRQAEKIRKAVEKYGKTYVTNGRAMEVSLQQWCEEAFLKAQLLIFVGAAGIAVRTIVPFVKDKFKDPAVLVADEMGKYVIPVLSGHVGRANEYAAQIAASLGAEAVITTATDLNGKFAVDVFAGKNQLVLQDRAWAKRISAAILQGEKIGFYCEGEIIGKLPDELYLAEQESLKEHLIFAGIHRGAQLIPKAVALGMGCRKGKTKEEIEQFVLTQLEEQQIALESIVCVASVDKKKEETGLCGFCEKYGLEFQTFSPEQLQQVQGEFLESAFVKENIGVGNVCERAAMRVWNGEKARIILNKTAENGMTLAIAKKEWSVTFE